MIAFDNTEMAFRHKSNSDLKKARFLFRTLASKPMVEIGKRLTQLAFFLHIPIKPLIKATLFKQFVGGESIDSCRKTSETLAKYGVGTILDYSVEGKEDADSFDATMREIIDTLEQARVHDYIPFAVFKPSGLCESAVLMKLQKGKTLNANEEKAWANACERMEKICETAHRYGCRILIDAEETWIQDPIDRMVEQLMQKFNRENTIVYNTLQMYRHDRIAYLEKITAHARQNGYKVGLKIVRGAYMEKEREYAAEMGLPDPIQPNKEACDRDYDASLKFCVENIDIVSLCAGTHNEKSSAFLVDLMEKNGISKEDSRIYFAQLLGMSDHISFNLANAGYNVVKYVPYGPVRELMPYLFRRAEENTSVKGQTGRELTLIQNELKRRGKL